MKNIFFIHLVLAALALAACGSEGSAGAVATLAPVPSDFADQTNPLGADAATAGAVVFKTNCEACHGPQGHGDGPASVALDPAPKNLVELQNKAGDDYLYWRINTGKEGTAMVAWKGILSDEQIWQVVAFLHTLK